MFDVTFLTSPWTCIFGRGCPGIAHRARRPSSSRAAAATAPTSPTRPTASGSAKRGRAARARRVAVPRRGRGRSAGRSTRTTTASGSPASSTAPASSSTGPASPPAPGCALHQAAVARGERFIDWKPDVCWQLPLRLEHQRRRQRPPHQHPAGVEAPGLGRGRRRLPLVVHRGPRWPSSARARVPGAARRDRRDGRREALSTSSSSTSRTAAASSFFPIRRSRSGAEPPTG